MPIQRRTSMAQSEDKIVRWYANECRSNSNNKKNKRNELEEGRGGEGKIKARRDDFLGISPFQASHHGIKTGKLPVYAHPKEWRNNGDSSSNGSHFHSPVVVNLLRLRGDGARSTQAHRASSASFLFARFTVWIPRLADGLVPVPYKKSHV